VILRLLTERVFAVDQPCEHWRLGFALFLNLFEPFVSQRSEFAIELPPWRFPQQAQDDQHRGHED